MQFSQNEVTKSTGTSNSVLGAEYTGNVKMRDTFDLIGPIIITFVCSAVTGIN